MTKAEKKAFYKCTTKGLVELLNDPKYVNDKGRQFQDMVNYIARFEMYGGKTKGELYEMIYTARNELLAQAGKKHMDSKEPFAYDDFGAANKNADARIKAFIRNPATAMQRELSNLAAANLEGQAEDNDERKYLTRLKVNANMLTTQIEVFRGNFDRVYAESGARTDIMNRLAKKLPEEDLDADDTLDKANRGFFGRLFRRPSKEYAAFENSFKDFHNNQYAVSGNVEDLEKKTNAYLKHVIPNFQYSKDMPKEQMLAALPKGQKARAEFAMNVLDSIHEHREAKPFMDNVDNAVNGRPVKEVPAKVEPAVEKQAQQEFQNQLDHDVVEEKIEENKNEIHADAEKAEEKEIENDNQISN